MPAPTRPIDAPTRRPRLRLNPMLGRDTNEPHRAATPLELLFDLVFVVAFSLAADEMAHYVADEHYLTGLLGFAFAMFGICWAWVSFTRFASAFDTDDWAYRVATMMQMIGVVIFALGLPAMFASLEEGDRLDNSVLVAGYVVMRVALVALWLRAAATDPVHGRTALGTALCILGAQVLWVLTAVIAMPVAVFFAFVLAIFVIEFGGPLLVQRRFGDIPWHAHHLVERYGLLVIIALGEGVLGTVAAVSVVVDGQGWSTDAIVLVVAGIGLTFGLWWVYFMSSASVILHQFRARQYTWGFAHIPLFAAIAAVGAGLHVVAYVIEGTATISATGAIATVAVSVLITALMSMVLFVYVTRVLDAFHIALMMGAAIVLVLAVALSWAGVPLSICLLVMILAPAVPVVGFEVAGHRHQAQLIERLLAGAEG